MLHNEFVEKMSRLGFETNSAFGFDGHAETSIYFEHIYMGRVDEREQGVLDTYDSTFKRLDDSKLQDFLSLLVEYVLTPVERRIEVKKYNVVAYTELAGHRDNLFSTEKFYGRSGDYLIVSDKFSNGTPEQQWTLDQIKDWNLEGFERIEVK